MSDRMVPGIKWRFSFGLVAMLALSAAGCTTRSEPAPIWVGHVATLSGPDRQAGEGAVRGIRLAVEEINKDLDQGLGRPLQVIHGDTRGSLDDFEAEAVRLAALNRVPFIYGGTTAEEVERLNRAPVLVLTPLGARTRTMSDAVFCIGLAPAQHAGALANVAAQELGASDVIVVCDGSRPESVELAEAFSRALPAAWAKKDAKVQVVLHQVRLARDGTQADVARALADKTKDGEASKAVFFAGKTGDLRELGPLSVPALFAGDEGSAPALAAVRAPGQDIYFATAFAVDQELPRSVEFAKRYREAFHQEADVHAALAYEGMTLLAEALLRSKDGLTPTRVRDELKKMKDFGGLAGALSFTELRQLERPAFVIRLGDGGAKTVKRYGPGT